MTRDNDDERSAPYAADEAEAVQPASAEPAITETTARATTAEVTASAPYPQHVEPADTPSPRVRVGAIVWGVLVVAFAALVVAVSASPGARDAFERWQASLSPAGWLLLGIIALGAVVLLIAGASAVRSAQRRAATRR